VRMPGFEANAALDGFTNAYRHFQTTGPEALAKVEPSQFGVGFCPPGTHWGCRRNCTFSGCRWWCGCLAPVVKI
jgi:hypothetical protein